jgi:hypothetical protein
MEKTYFERDIDDDIGVPQRRRLEVRDALEQIKARYYQVELEVADLSTSPSHAIFSISSSNAATSGCDRPVSS